ncbi:zinc finger BED domain-containing protein RICESLEEPER 2-like [Apium graveolens]|uniref:zinc finger BED domain-containing protein RICESLEEPER 2-like n=1 Tax=Apium graveolens TaxID=4045 RepID=UPI003D7A6CCE
MRKAELTESVRERNIRHAREIAEREENERKYAQEFEMFEQRSNELKAKGLSRVSPNGVFLHIKTHKLSRGFMAELRNTKKRKNQNDEIFPPTVPYIDESHITIRSCADESLSEDDCEQEELSLLSKKLPTTDKDTITTLQGTDKEFEKEKSEQARSDQPYQKKPRKKTSKVWDYMAEFKDGDKVVYRCKLCGKDFIKSDISSTSAMKRHLERCVKEYGGTLQTQLQFQRGSNDEVKLASFKYDHALMREKISHYIMINELPFMHVKSYMFNEIMRTATPLFQKITRGTLKGDCNTTYEIEKKKLKEKFKSAQKINITTDMWTSSHQKLGYMVITAHWINIDWKLNSRVLNFCNVPPPHSGYIIADLLYKSLLEWGIEDKIGTVTVDNAKANDVAIRNLKDSYGLKPINPIVGRIRDGVKYVSASEGRLIKFAEIVNLLQLKSKKLILDVSTRWNYTYYMLHAALQFRDVFLRFALWYRAFSEYVPSDEDWEKVKDVCSLLHIFEGATKIVSGSQYPTSNLFLSELKRVKELIDKKVGDSNLYMRDMANAMKEKIDKYWGESNLMMSIGAVMDPRFKLKLLNYCFPVIYPLEGQSEKN